MIMIYDRKHQAVHEEKVVGSVFLKFLYETPVGAPFRHLLRRKAFSAFYGYLMDRPFSRRLIPGFVRDNGIHLEEAVKKMADFENFNDFFIRELNTGARPFSAHPLAFPSPADARLLALPNLKTDQVLQIKGMTYDLGELLGDDESARRYDGGTALVFRLNPQDYHRFHYMDDGMAEETQEIPGWYYSVNPMALRKVPRLYVQNKRSITPFVSDHFGTLTYVEVGATNVGTILQTRLPHTRIHRGEEKGYFKFGGSTVILFVEKGQLTVDQDILAQSASGVETRVLCGETVGRHPLASQDT
ncbi:phosphatidylserine decarboxylase [Proteiniclasticum sp. BAD-10]|uniref:phosphatidylserine decarboxylase n=1 Tax=Proteiniclasticum sediminis TaxID=2804028 RepID=A0A941CQG9_9CLOT|nr:archaetidylserine decarboxylase [Proteiniclasticum sediminis]MBR0576847.1 phosphatidylserine decarboxylase [Proteiniclasticum sediminis]